MRAQMGITMQTEAMTTEKTASTDDRRYELVMEAIEEIRPALKRDGGDCELLSIEGKTVNVKLTGACVFCSLASATLEGIQSRIVEKLGELVRVVPAPMGLKKSGH
jgi:Fe-S cluster biogenesis protein NfuA